MSPKKSKPYNWAPVLIVFLLVLLIFAVIILPAWNKLNISTELESHETLAERQARINIENAKLKAQVIELGITQLKLARRFLWAYVTFTIGFLITVSGVQVALYYILKYYNLGNLIIWDSTIGGAFIIVYTIITRKKFSFHELVIYFESKIKNAVYGDLITIDEDISTINNKIIENEQELVELTEPSVTIVIVPEQQQNFITKS